MEAGAICQPSPPLPEDMRSSKSTTCYEAPPLRTTHEDTTVVLKKIKRTDEYEIRELIPIKSFLVDVSYLPVAGGDTVEMEQPVRVQYQREDGLAVAEDWNVALPMDRIADDLPKRMGREFLSLYSQSMDRSISEENALRFERLCHSLDLGGFEASRSLPAWHSAKLIRDRRKWSVEFLTGDVEPITEELRGRLLVGLDEGDWFHACFQFDRENHITSIENVRLIAPPNETPPTERRQKRFSDEAMAFFGAIKPAPESDSDE